MNRAGDQLLARPLSPVMSTGASASHAPDETVDHLEARAGADQLVAAGRGQRLAFLLALLL